MTPEQRRARGFRAKALLDSDDVKDALAEIEADITAEWKRSVWPWRQRQKWNELRGLERLKARLTSWASHAPRD